MTVEQNAESIRRLATGRENNPVRQDARVADLIDMSEREYFANVRKRLGMYVIGKRLTGLEAFLDGYAQHALRHGGPGLDGWRDWLVARRGHDCNHAWHGQVRHIALPDGWDSWDLPPSQEARVIEVLFDLLDEFLAERATAVREQA
jgi:hypothetical protein